MFPDEFCWSVIYPESVKQLTGSMKPCYRNCITAQTSLFPKCDLQRRCRAENPVSMTICPIPVPGEAWGESVKSHRCHVYSATSVTYPSRSPTFAGDKCSAQQAKEAHWCIRLQTFPEPALCAKQRGEGTSENRKDVTMSICSPNASPLGKEGTVGWKGSIEDYTHSLLLVWNRQYP